VLDRSARLLCVAAQMALSSTGLQQQEGGKAIPNLGLVGGTMFGSVTASRRSPGAASPMGRLT